MKIKIIMMLKNEDELARPWIRYHGVTVGYHNLFIFDNGSTSNRTLLALKQGAEAGATVYYSHCSPQDFVQKGRIFADLIREMDLHDPADFYLPLDCDEFLACKYGDRVDCSRDGIVENLGLYAKNPSPLAIAAGLDNHPRKPAFFRWSPTQRKTFFAEGACASLDHGFHVGRSRLGSNPVQTGIVYIHYHFRPHALLIEHSKAKLSPFTTDFSRDNMIAYVAQKREGWHCAAHLLSSEDNYCTDDAAFVEFPEIRARFEELGEHLPFSLGAESTVR
jgi:hypothetical protein